MKKFLVILKLLSPILTLLSIMFVFPLIVSIYYGESLQNILAYSISGLAVLSFGLLFRKITRNVELKIDAKTSMVFTTLVWGILTIIGSLPFIFIVKISPIDALFESAAGFTTTGMSIVEDVSSLPNSMLFFKSIMQFLGGLGILTFFLLLFSSSASGNTWYLFGAEGHKASSERPVANIYSTIKIFWTMYIVLALTQTGILILLGVEYFDALCHGLTTISTGGISIHNESIAHYGLNGYDNYVLIEYTFIFFMLLGGINFLIHYRFLKGKLKAYFEDSETKSYLLIVVGATFLIMFCFYFVGFTTVNFHDAMTIESAFRHSLFGVVTLITSSGFTNGDIVAYPEFVKIIFLALMLMGGCIGSTSGGLKVYRVMVLRKGLTREVKKINQPVSAIMPFKVGDEVIPNDDYITVASLFYGWISFIIFGTLFTLLFADVSAFEAFTGMTSALSNMGPTFFESGVIANFNGATKLLYVIAMIAGRLELLPLFIVFRVSTYK